MNRLLFATFTTIAGLSVNLCQPIPEAIAQTETNFQASNTKDTNKFPVNQVLSALRGKTTIPIFLPSEVPFSTNKLYYQNKAEKNNYIVEMSLGIKCGGACYVGNISAERGGKIKEPPTTFRRGTEYKNITLANQTAGIFFQGCGAYCIAIVEWEYQGVLYRVNMKNGKEANLIKIANSAIKAGPR